MAKVSIRRCRQFPEDETGAVTVDWVVLTAAVVGISFAVLIPVFSATESTSNTVNSTLHTAMINASETN